jgi:alpha-beta hydrolase superfamily lysophospholipase
MSLGGAVTFNVLLKQPNLVNGAVFLSPSIRENNSHFPIMKKLIFLLSNLFPYQQLLKQTGRNGSKYHLDHYSRTDPYLYHGRLYAKTVQEMLLAMAHTRKQYSKFSTPYLVIQSGKDKLVDPFACLDLEELSPALDKTTVIIYDMWHAIWLDDHATDAIMIMQEWLEERV